MKKILVIDGNSIINRAFYGIRALTNKDGKPTNAVYGMLNIVLRHLDAIRPDYAAVAFDLKAPNFRKQRFSYYKEGRHETPPELLAQFDDAKECLRLLGLHTLELEGYEADDILGTVAEYANREEGLHAYVLSGDRDLLQLISPNVTVLLASTGDTLTFDRNAFFEKYGIEPEEFVDLKALMGDTSDRIPGVPGIGEKTAIKLIAEFHSVEGVYEHLDSPSITKGNRAKLEAGRQSALDSRFLAEICRTVPLEEDLSALAYGGMDCGGLYRKCVELDFLQLIRKLKLSPTPTEPRTDGLVCADCAAPTEGDGAACPHDQPIYNKYVEKSAQELVSLFPVGASLALGYEDGLCFSDGKECYKTSAPLSSLAPLFDGSRRVVLYGGKPFLHMLYREGLGSALIPTDLLLYAYVLRAGESAPSLDGLLLRYLDRTLTEGEEATGHLLALERVMAERIEAEGMSHLLHEIELPLSPVLARMERVGFRIDRAALEAFGRALAEEIAVYTESIYALAGVDFNINSPKQLGEVLFDRLMLPTKGLKKTQNGYSTDADTLKTLSRYHPIIDEILAFRQVTKLHSTYVAGLLKVADEDGRIHTEFKQAQTATGRLSSAEPNLQNIPIRTRLGRELRRVFITENEDYLLVDADYSQIELRLLAAFSEDEVMCRAFREGADIHARTAAAVFGLPEYAVTDELRKQAKAVNFGIVYGISAYSLSGDIGVSVAEAKRYMDSYFAEFPRIREYLDGVIAAAERDGYTTTCHGRRRDIPELSSRIFAQRAFGKRVAMNSPIQGSAADIIKLAMIRVDRRLREEGLDARLILQVHDELIVEAHKSAAKRVRAILTEEMQGAAELSVPLTVSVGTGENWLDAEH